MKLLNTTPARELPDRFVFFMVFFAFAYLSIYYLSGTRYPVMELDSSWQAVLEHAARLKFQFGRDIVFTFGPLGYLYSSYSQGYMIGLRIIFAFFWTLLIAFTATSLVRQTRGWIRAFFIAWFLIFFYGSMDAAGSLVIAYGSLLLMSDVRERKTISALFIVALALLSLIKFTFFLSAVVGIVLAAIMQLAGKRFHAAWILSGCFSAVFLLVWLAAGQETALLWPWLKASLSISAGYTEAMTRPPHPWVLGLCVSAAILFLVALIIIIRRSKMTLNRAAYLTVILLDTFLAWKHGLVRSHVFTFTCFLPIAFLLALMYLDKNNLSAVVRNTTTILYGGVIILTVIAGNIQEEGFIETAITGFPIRLLNNSKRLVKTVTGDWQDFYAAVRMGAAQPRNPDLTQARSDIGGATVDVINYRQWAALSNNLNYHPRPVFQGYSAYTPYLQDLNLSFYRSERRPQFILFNLETIDDRYPMLDDATVLPFIFKNYQPIALDGIFLVLRRNEGAAVDINVRLVHEQSLAFDEILDLAKWNNNLLIVQTIVRPSFFGRLYAFLYEAPVLTMNIFTREAMYKTRFIPAMAERGFIVNPLLFDNKDVVNLYQHTGTRVGGVSFSRGGVSDLLTSDTITVKVFLAM